ncbi:MAG: helix-turn-helix transcriptional regulator, partial [Nocardioidaceae bacterium]
MQQRSDADPGPERQDTFSRFLETLASGLGGTMGTPEELAARAHLSRFHFDRIISATAGEPPVRFRRRILLERAAYRLISTEHGVLDISLDAGYGSHEAFTRAFQRAYGVSPSRWRRRPSKFQLPAPSSVHFHPPDGLRLPAGSEVGSMDLVVRMVEHHIWLIGEMVERAVRLTD